MTGWRLRLSGQAQSLRKQQAMDYLGLTQIVYQVGIASGYS